MIRTFLIIFSVFVMIIVGVFGFRGQKFRNTPAEFLPDMDRMDKLMGQEKSDFFSDGVGSRPVVPGTVPHGADESLYSIEFSAGRDGYYYTGRFGDYYGSGMPKELELTAENAEAFLKRGEGRYAIYCAVCHGEAGDGAGVTSKYGVPGIANFHAPNFSSDQYADGRLYDVIANGKGVMGSYGSVLPVRDRWAVVAYVRALQNSKSVDPKELSNNN